MAWRVTSARDLPPAVEAALREQGEMIDLVWARQQEHAAEPSPAADADPRDASGEAGGWGFWRGVQLAALGYAALIIARLLGVL